MSTRALLIKNKLIEIIDTLNADGVKAWKVYTEASKSQSALSDKTNVFPIEERTQYKYHFEDGMSTRLSGESNYLLGGETWITTKTLENNNDLAYQRYSSLISKLESVLVDYQEFEVTNNTTTWVCGLQLVDSSSDIVANVGRAVFNIRIKIKWVVK